MELTGIEPDQKNRESTEKQATSSAAADRPGVESPNGVAPFAAIVAEVAEPLSDESLTAAIVEAVKLGLGDVARTLANQLQERQRARTPNVVTLDSTRRRGGR